MLTLLFTFLAVSLSGASTENSTLLVVQRTLPAYALAIIGKTSLDASNCSRQLDAFRDAVDHRKLWALKSQYKIFHHLFAFSS